jgi:hypothetical protein
VRLRAFFTDILPDLKLTQLLNHVRTNQQTDQQRRQARKHRAKRKIAKDSEEPVIGKKFLIQQPIEQNVSAFDL